jgi:hypothetical protein
LRTLEWAKALSPNAGSAAFANVGAQYFGDAALGEDLVLSPAYRSTRHHSHIEQGL